MQKILGLATLFDLFAVQAQTNAPDIGSIVISNGAKIGSNLRINVGVVIGENKGIENAPTIGNHVIIEPGSKIFGKIEIADGIHIGANAVVNKSFLESGIVIAGVPARKIKDNPDYLPAQRQEPNSG